jgi:2,3-diketo-5-methylthio-1-phosphopentane phosphatase
MASTNSETPALATNPKFIFFTDFDGTVTTADSNDFMTDNLGFGKAKRVESNKGVLFGHVHFRDSFQEMLDSINTPFNECLEILKKNIVLDPGFAEFYNWSRENNVPIVILSGGMEPVIRALLDILLGPGWDIQIVSNDVTSREGKDLNEKGGWTIKFHDDRFVFRLLRLR